jgi:hypothetical protein
MAKVWTQLALVAEHRAAIRSRHASAPGA